MENASKALIIAGAILLAILIIALGVMVYNNAKETVGSADLSSTEITSFNSQWESYVGDNKTAAQIKSMFSAVIASNASETNNGTARIVTINNQTVNAQPTNIISSTTYKVVATYNNATGLITDLNYTNNN